MARQGRKTNIGMFGLRGNYVALWVFIFCPQGLGQCSLTTLCPRAVALRKALSPCVAAVEGLWVHLKNNNKITMPFLLGRDLSEKRLKGEVTSGNSHVQRKKALNVK